MEQGKAANNTSFLRELLPLAIPIVLQSMFSTAVGLADSFMLNFVGQDELAAVSLANQPQFVLIGPNVMLCSTGHPVHYKLRPHGEMYSFEVIIEDNVWIGGNVSICPGVRIGANSVIGAGSVVIKTCPPTPSPRATPARPSGKSPTGIWSIITGISMCDARPKRSRRQTVPRQEKAPQPDPTESTV